MTPQAKKKTEKRTETALPPKERTIQKRIRKNKNRRRKKKIQENSSPTPNAAAINPSKQRQTTK